MLNVKPVNSIIINWEIDPNEQKERKSKELASLVIKILPILLGMIFLQLLSSRHFSFSEALNILFYTASFIIVWAVVYYIYLIYISRSKSKKYFLNSEGIRIIKGNKEKFYPWSDFECFYPFEIIRSDRKNLKFSGNKTLSKENRGKIIEILQEEQKINGQIFHLKKKSDNILGKIYKIFVVIQSEPDNSKAVNDFLSDHLPKKEMTGTTDLGLVFYEFK